MTYNFYELVLLIILLVSLVIKVPKNIFNVLAFLTLLVVIISPNLIFDNIMGWEIIIKSFCIIMGVLAINSHNTNIIDSSHILMVCVVLASMIMVSTSNLLGLYLSLELQSLSLFILIARQREKVVRIEASLKYFVLSSISSGLFLLGSALLFISSGTCEIYTLSIQSYSVEKILILVALMFKLAASPFHLWLPDVYQGSDNSTLLVLGTLPKISVFGVLIILLPTSKFVLMITIISLVIGCVGAINQSKIKRLLAYSSIVAIGFIMLGVSLNSYQGIEASTVYIMIYLLSFSALILILKNSINEKSLIMELSSLLSSNITTVAVFGLLVLSIAGIPPLGGFFSKWLVLSCSISSDFIISSIVAILCAVVAGVYYLRLVKVGYFQQDKTFLIWKKVLLKNNIPSENQGLLLGMLLYFIMFIILCPHIILMPIHYGTVALF